METKKKNEKKSVKQNLTERYEKRDPTVELIEEGPRKLDSYVLYVGKKDKPSWPPFEPRNPTRNYVELLCSTKMPRQKSTKRKSLNIICSSRPLVLTLDFLPLEHFVKVKYV